MNEETQPKRLPVRAAYQFARERGYAERAERIQNMAIDPQRHKPTRVRRGYMAQLFRDHACLDEFLQRYWPHGQTKAGQRYLRVIESARLHHAEGLGSVADEDDEEDDEALEEESAQAFALEADLRDFLSHNLSVLEPGLQLYEKDGRKGVEYPVEDGRIDILAVDKEGHPVVIELKLSRGRNKALGQLLYYMGWADRHLPNPPARGIIVAEEITDSLRTAAARVPGVSLYEYEISMNVHPVSTTG